MSTSQIYIPSGARLQLIGNAPQFVDIGFIHNAVFARLISWSGLRALLGVNIFLGTLPQTPSYPALVINEVFSEAYRDMQGNGDLDRTQFQFDLLGEDYNELVRIGRQLELCFKGIDGTFAGVKIWGARLLNRMREPYEPGAELQRLMLEFELWHDNISP